MQNRLEDYPFKEGKLFVVDNYLEAVGVMNALKAGIAIDTVRRPISFTNCICDTSLNNSYKQNHNIENKSEEENLERMIS